YAPFVAAVLLLAVGIGFRGLDRRGIVGFVIAGAMLLVTLALSQSRSTLVLLLLGGAGFALGMGVPLASRWSLLAAAPLALVAAPWAIASKVSFEELWREGWLGRIAIWRGSLRMFLGHWLFGVGLGRFWDYFEQYRINMYYTRYPHSFLLEVLAELGIV